MSSSKANFSKKFDQNESTKRIMFCCVCFETFLIENSDPIICPDCGNNEDYGPIEEVESFV